MALPAFVAIDRMLEAFLGPLARLVAWGFLMSVLSMVLYRLISPQQKLARIKSEAAAARQQMAAFEGEFDELTPLIGHSLRLSLQHVAWIFFPALLASLPLVGCLIFLDSTYSFRVPAANEPVRVSVSPSGEPISAVPASALTRTIDGWQIQWPKAGDVIVLYDRSGSQIARLHGIPGHDTIEPHTWWNRLIGNPMGYVPGATPVRKLHFELTALELHGVGPPWTRGWETPFFLTLIIFSIAIKVAFRIE